MYGRRPAQRDAAQWTAIAQQHQQRKQQLVADSDDRSTDSGSEKGDGAATHSSGSTQPPSPPRSLTRRRIDAPPPPPPPHSTLPITPLHASVLPLERAVERMDVAPTAASAAIPPLRPSAGNAFSVLMAPHATARQRKRRAESAGLAVKAARGSPSGVDRSSGSGGSGGASEGCGATQLFLDFGQSLKGFTACGECGCVYQSGSPTDEQQHKQQHQRHVKGIAFNGWHDEPPNLLAGLPRPLPRPLQPSITVAQAADRLLRLDSSHLLRHPAHAAKAREITARLGRQLGSSGSGEDSGSAPAASPPLAAQLTLYFYVRDRRVIAAMTVRSDVEAAPIVQSQSSGGSYQLSLGNRRVVAIGIEQVWVIDRHRRQGVASRMLDACRMTHVYVPQSREDIAFSQPTSAGRQLAQRYTGKHDFLAYA